MAAVASQQPHVIRRMIERVSPSLYQIRFHASPTEVVEANVTSEVPFAWFSSRPLYAASRHGTWVSLIEKAYAKAFLPEEGYEGIGGDHPRPALERLTGWQVIDYDVDGDLSEPDQNQEWEFLLAQYRRGAPMVAGSRIFQPRADIVPMHAYAITGIEEHLSGVRLLRLFDPEGLNAYPNFEIVLRLDELNDYFYYVSIAEPPTDGLQRPRSAQADPRGAHGASTTDLFHRLRARRSASARAPVPRGHDCRRRSCRRQPPLAIAHPAARHDHRGSGRDAPRRVGR